MSDHAHRQILWGDVPVPYAAAWSAEEGRFTIGTCEHTGRVCLLQTESRGEGKPVFGKPHNNRQREVVMRGLCDICAKSLKTCTKVSLSHVRPVETPQGVMVSQVEPLLHRRCAALSLRHCPSLRRDVRNGTLFVRQVTRYTVLLAELTPEAIAEFTGQTHHTRSGARHTGIYGHAKVALLDWRDRDEAWLRFAEAA